MRITLLHNPTAGDAEHGKKQLLRALEKAGHEVRYQSTKKDDYKLTLKKPCDLVLAAGGDGTIAKAARQLLDTGIPLSVLPLGTANNLARSLGFFTSPEEIIARLENGEKRTFDVGIARGPWGAKYFFEAVGAGLLADYVRAAKEDDKKTPNGSKEHELSRHVALLRRLLHDYRPQQWKIRIDDEDISGEYILWEGMNIRSIGPALYLAPRAATKDGELDFVCARERDRGILMHHLDARLAGKKPEFPLPIRRFRKLDVIWEGATIQIDDKVWPKKKEKPPTRQDIEIAVQPSSLVILQPNRGGE